MDKCLERNIAINSCNDIVEGVRNRVAGFNLRKMRSDKYLFSCRRMMARVESPRRQVMNEGTEWRGKEGIRSEGRWRIEEGRGMEGPKKKERTGDEQGGEGWGEERGGCTAVRQIFSTCPCCSLALSPQEKLSKASFHLFIQTSEKFEVSGMGRYCTSILKNILNFTPFDDRTLKVLVRLVEIF